MLLRLPWYAQLELSVQNTFITKTVYRLLTDVFIFPLHLMQLVTLGNCRWPIVLVISGQAG